MANAQVHQDVMKAWRLIAMQRGLLPQEIITLAANLAGLAVDDCIMTEDGGYAVLEVAQMAMTTAWWGKRKERLKKAGWLLRV